MRYRRVERAADVQELKGAGIAVMGLAAIGFIGGMWYDALDAGDAVDRWRTRARHHVAPTAGR